MFETNYKKRVFIIVKTPMAHSIDCHEFTIGEIDDGSQFDSSLPYDHKIRNLHKIKKRQTVDSMEKADLILAGVAMAAGDCEIIKIKFPEPFLSLLKKLKHSASDDAVETFKNLATEFTNLFGRFK